MARKGDVHDENEDLNLPVVANGFQVCTIGPEQHGPRHWRTLRGASPVTVRHDPALKLKAAIAKAKQDKTS